MLLALQWKFYIKLSDQSTILWASLLIYLLISFFSIFDVISKLSGKLRKKQLFFQRFLVSLFMSLKRPRSRKEHFEVTQCRLGTRILGVVLTDLSLCVDRLPNRQRSKIVCFDLKIRPDDCKALYLSLYITRHSFSILHERHLVNYVIGL